MKKQTNKKQQEKQKTKKKIEGNIISSKIDGAKPLLAEMELDAYISPWKTKQNKTKISTPNRSDIST